MIVTDDDRFVLTALATAVEAEVGKDTIVTDNLFRQASLWGAHPTGEIVLQPITGEAGHSWTTLCSAGACNSGATYRTFYHSGGSTERSAPCGSHAGTTQGTLAAVRQDRSDEPVPLALRRGLQRRRYERVDARLRQPRHLRVLAHERLRRRAERGQRRLQLRAELRLLVVGMFPSDEM